MIDTLNRRDLHTSKAENTFRHILLVKSSDGEILRFINYYLSHHKKHGQPIEGYHAYKTYARIPLIKNIHKSVIYSSNENYSDRYIKTEFSSDCILSKGEIPIATEVLSFSGKKRKVIAHEIAVNKINLENILDKYKDTWYFLGDTLNHAMENDNFQIVIWGWSQEFKAIWPLLSSEEVKLIKKGKINLVPLSFLKGAALKYFKRK